MSRLDAAVEVTPYEQRLARAVSLQQALSHLDLGPDAAAHVQAERWLAGTDSQQYVGSVHHTVPRFLLERWSRREQVKVYSRIADRYTTRNVKDLAVRDFYTYLEDDGRLNSTFESLLGVIESPVADITKRLLSSFTSNISTSSEEKFALAQFASFQVVRTTRRRREMELQAEYWAKTMAGSELSDATLRHLSVVPHQNTALKTAMQNAQQLLSFFAFRPLEIVFLREARLHLGDEPLLINAALDDGHTADCLMTDEEFERRVAREARKKLKRRGSVSRVVHLRPTQGQGVGVALEMILPISPRALLWWGPLQRAPFQGSVAAQWLSVEESKELAGKVNRATIAQALDWVISSVDDEDFLTVPKPPLEPLLTVCDGDNAAAAALNAVPNNFRPGRLAKF